MRFFVFFFSILIPSAFCETISHQNVTVVQSSRIDENSGIDLSYKYPNTVWTHNDSGGKPYLYLVSLESGKTLAIVKVENSINRDWEDITTFQKDGKSFIIVADTGDNPRRRKEYQLCIFEEPELDISLDNGDPIKRIHSQKEWIDLRFRYEDGKKNCESIGVDLENQQIILIEKINQKVKGITGVYRLDLPQQSVDNAVAHRFADLEPKNFSALDISDQGTTLLARAYHAGYIFRRAPEQTWAEVFAQPIPKPIEFPMQLQGEGVCFTFDGKSVLISTEKKRQPIFKVELPKN